MWLGEFVLLLLSGLVVYGLIIALAIAATVFIAIKYKSWPPIAVIWILACLPFLYVMHHLSENSRRIDRSAAAHRQKVFDRLCARPMWVEFLAKPTSSQSRLHFKDLRSDDDGFTPVGGIEMVETIGASALFPGSQFDALFAETTSGAFKKKRGYVNLSRDAAGVHMQKNAGGHFIGVHQLHAYSARTNPLETTLVLMEDTTELARGTVFLYAQDEEKRYACPDYRQVVKTMINGTFQPGEQAGLPAAR